MRSLVNGTSYKYYSGDSLPDISRPRAFLMPNYLVNGRVKEQNAKHMN
jgi:hypothetical protein